jgi:hypothetical protein
VVVIVRMDVRELGGLNMLTECLLLLKEPERALKHLNRYIYSQNKKKEGKERERKQALMHLNWYIFILKSTVYGDFVQKIY